METSSTNIITGMDSGVGIVASGDGDATVGGTVGG